MGAFAPHKFLDAGVWAVLVFLLSGFGLSMIQHLHGLTKRPEITQYPPVVNFFQKVFPSKKFEYNLTHILLFAILLVLLSFRPDSEFETTEQKKGKKKSKAKVTTEDSD